VTVPLQRVDLDADRAGLSIAGCHLLRLLEDNGMTRSYLARYLETSLVIVKLFDDTLVGGTVDADDTYRWECEALLALRHRALPQTVGFGHCDAIGCGYLVQELIPGVRVASLRRALGRAFRPAEAADLLLPVADALVFCHRQGLTHGHLTAAHVLLEPHAPVPRTRLAGLRPRLASDPAGADDTRALATLAYAMTVEPGARVSPLPELLAGVPGARASEDDAWNALLLRGLCSFGDERMRELRDGLAHLLNTRTCTHRTSAVLARALPPLDAAVEDSMTRPLQLPPQFIEPLPPREDPDTGPTTLWVSPDAPVDEVESAWAADCTPSPAPPGMAPKAPHVHPEEAPTRPHLHVVPAPQPESMSATQELDPAVLARLQRVPELAAAPPPVAPSSPEERPPALWWGAFVGVAVVGAALAMAFSLA
jgi:hypothetical protein